MLHSSCSHGDDNRLNSLIKEQEALLSVTLCGSTVTTSVCVCVCVCVWGSDVSSSQCLSRIGDCLLRLRDTSLLVLEVINLPAQMNLFWFFIIFYIVLVGLCNLKSAADCNWLSGVKPCGNKPSELPVEFVLIHCPLTGRADCTPHTLYPKCHRRGRNKPWSCTRT